MHDIQSTSEEATDPLIRMLSVFYTTQRDRDPRSINATYILSGVPRAPNQSCGNGHQLDGEDTHMQSSPYMSSSMPDQDGQEEATPSRVVFLVNEEDLEGKYGLPASGLRLPYGLQDVCC